ncbi:hypothetical protein [Streptomyces sp. NPDC093094]|uniref:hypothetical protein n=1 Tax=Streptomyces sp. NPDC093094 TaxID=3366026 RepID=UPI00380BF79B
MTPPRVAEWVLRLEARARALTPGAGGRFLGVGCEVLRVHADEHVVVPGTRHIGPGRRNPLVCGFRHHHGLAPEAGHGFRSQTAGRPAAPAGTRGMPRGHTTPAGAPRGPRPAGR